MLPSPLRAGALLALLVAALAMPATALACRDANLMPTPATVPRVRAALVCVANRERAARGLEPLREDARLRRAATAHSAEEVARGYYGHASANGNGFAARILAFRYATRRDDYVLGEDLAWSAGELSTPAAVVAAWLRSPSQRANLLDRTFRDFGAGVRAGIPKDASVGATFTVDFGVKR